MVKKTASILLGLLFVQRLVILLACPDLLHDWDAGELKHLDLALFGLPAGDGDFLDSVTRWLSAPENIHHGGYVVVSVLYAAASAIFGHSLFLLRSFSTDNNVVGVNCKRRCFVNSSMILSKRSIKVCCDWMVVRSCSPLKL